LVATTVRKFARKKKKKKHPLVLIGESLPLCGQSCKLLVEKQSTFLGIIYGNILKKYEE
jgi:hypothetical protein